MTKKKKKKSNFLKADNHLGNIQLPCVSQFGNKQKHGFVYGAVVAVEAA